MIRFIKLFKLISIFIVILLTSGYTGIIKNEERHSGVFGTGENLRMPHILGGFSKKFGKQSSRRSLPYRYSILHGNNYTRKDTLKIIALRVEFKLDSSTSTTGNGQFGISRNGLGTREDIDEVNLYRSDTVYHFDNLPHDYTYLENHLKFARNYFNTVSNGKFHIDYEIFPKGQLEENAFTVPKNMIYYSPGEKRKDETYSDYDYRKTKGLMEFIKDALLSSEKDPIDDPFANIRRGNDGILYEEIKNKNGAVIGQVKVGILIFHAGASYLTDGGVNGTQGRNTPSDMIDAFITPEHFAFFKDSIADIQTINGNSGIEVKGKENKALLIDEVMMLPETSNQDKLNWGINGILVNQIARQIGIPDLFGNGFTGIGGFCIMDFAGYSTSRGFIPPWPSAWVRAFMGWDKPVVIKPHSQNKTVNLSSISTGAIDDTTIVLIPINNNEFYLLENKQRNLTSDNSKYNYDTTDGVIHLSRYDHVNLKKNVISTFPENDGHRRNVIDKVHNYDIGIPASGVIVWHIDEYVIRDHFENNQLNSDSTYRGVHLEEADGTVDLGIMFRDVFYQAVFDYGGAEDIFPHQRSKGNTPLINTMAPYTSPSTRANDGGHSYIKFTISPTGKSPTGRTKELCPVLDNYHVYNFVDSTFSITIGKTTNELSSFEHWPQKAIKSQFFEPVLVNIDQTDKTQEIAVVDTAGRVYIYNSSADKSYYRPVAESTTVTLYSNKKVFGDSVHYVVKLPSPAAMPTNVNDALVIPTKSGQVFILNSINENEAQWQSINMGAPLSSYISSLKDGDFVVGSVGGDLLYSNIKNQTVNKVSIRNSPLNGITLLDKEASLIATVSQDGAISVINNKQVVATFTLSTPEVPVFPPFKIISGDLDQDTKHDIIISDNKQGVWLLVYDPTTKSLRLGDGWSRVPNDWAGYYRLGTDRQNIPSNSGAPSLADLNGDNILDIVVGGTNGVYAFTHTNVMLVNWPGILDNRYWYQRGTVQSTPVITYSQDNKTPYTLFAAPTGEKITWAIAHIDSLSRQKKTVYFTQKDGIQDSITDLTDGFMDSLFINNGDSLIAPYIAPGGYIDVFNTKGKRPDTLIAAGTNDQNRRSQWPISVGGSISTSPLLTDIDNNGKLDIFAVTDDGLIYRWETESSTLSPSIVWAQAGADNGRSFRYNGPVNPIVQSSTGAIEYFYSYPNPAKSEKIGKFKYKLTKNASNVRLDIFTMTNFHVFSQSGLPGKFGLNEYKIPLRKFGTGVYRCRIEAEFDSGKVVKFWKMAVIK